MTAPLLHNMDEAGLAKYCAGHNAAAQKVLFTRYADGMMMLCLRYIPVKEDAREALMDGFLACFKNIGSFVYQGEGSLKAWLKKIVVNQCLMHLRRKHLSFVPHNEDAHGACYESGESVLEQINAKQIISLIQDLPEGCRTIFNLYVFERMNHREIAELLAVTESTSKSQLHRARALLKEKLITPAKATL